MQSRTIHYISGLMLSVFIGLHVFNHFYGLWGAEAHIELTRTLRVFYRNTFVEALLLLAVVIQIVSGIKLFRSRGNTRTSWFEKLHHWTGLYMAIFLVLHVSAVFAGRLLLKLDTNFYFGVAGLNTFPFNLFFIPYYGLAIFSVFGHVASVHNLKMKKTILGITPRQQALFILISGIVLVPVIFYGLTNHFQGVTIPSDYYILIGR